MVRNHLGAEGVGHLITYQGDSDFMELTGFFLRLGNADGKTESQTPDLVEKEIRETE